VLLYREYLKAKFCSSCCSVIFLLCFDTGLKLAGILDAAEEFKNFVDQNDWNREGENGDPFLLVVCMNRKDLVQEGNVDDDAVKHNRVDDGED